MRKSWTAILAAALAVGCAGPMVWVKDGASETQAARDYAECDYDATRSVTTVDGTYRTMLGQDLDMAMRQGEVIRKCMRLRGYDQRPR